VRQDVIGILAHTLREWLHGNGLPIEEVYACVDTRIEEAIREAVQDAIREIRPQDE
jgi:hypothetical protein